VPIIEFILWGVVYAISVQDAMSQNTYFNLSNHETYQGLFDIQERYTFFPDTSDTVKIEDLKGFKYIENNAFAVGERLTFEISVGLIKAGTATMSILDTQWVRGRPCYHIVTTAESNKILSAIYKVNDRIESFVDVDGLFPWKFEKHIREGKYRADQYVVYDHPNQRVITKNDTVAVQPFIQGILSSFYYVRTQDLKVGKSFDIDNYGDGKIYPIKIHVHAKDRVKVPAGTFDCIVVEPVLREKGIFNQKGRMAVWLTNDDRRLPVLMKSKILVGSVNAKLISFKTGEL